MGSVTTLALTRMAFAISTHGFERIHFSTVFHSHNLLFIHAHRRTDSLTFLRNIQHLANGEPELAPGTYLGRALAHRQRQE